MKITRSHVAPLALGVALVLWLAGILGSMRFGVSSDLVLRNTLRDVTQAAQEGKDASTIRQLADVGLERAEQIRRKDSRNYLPILLFLSGAGIVTGALIFESIRANRVAGIG